MHRLSSPDIQYRQITNRGLGGILSTSTSTSGKLELTEVSVCAWTGSSVAPLGICPTSCGSLTAACFFFRLIFWGKSVLISPSISSFLLAYLFLALVPSILLLDFPEPHM